MCFIPLNRWQTTLPPTHNQVNSFPRLFLGYVVSVVVYLFVMFLFDGEDMDWKKSLITASIAGVFAMGSLYFFGKKKEKSLQFHQNNS